MEKLPIFITNQGHQQLVFISNDLIREVVYSIFFSILFVVIQLRNGNSYMADKGRPSASEKDGTPAMRRRGRPSHLIQPWK